MLPGDLPIIAATDYVRALPQLIGPYVEGRLVALGTDGFGRSDKRAVLRKFFEVDSKSIVIAAIEALAKAEIIEYSVLTAALNRYEIDGDTPAPWTIWIVFTDNSSPIATVHIHYVALYLEAYFSYTARFNDIHFRVPF